MRVTLELVQGCQEGQALTCIFILPNWLILVAATSASTSVGTGGYMVKKRIRGALVPASLLYPDAALPLVRSP